MSWEVNWKRYSRDGCYWAREPDSCKPLAREWHWVQAGNLRLRGFTTPPFARHTWEVNWSKRKGKLVWARNKRSRAFRSRRWHWVDFHGLERAGIKWIPKKTFVGKHKNHKGYICLTRRAMTEHQLHLADANNLWHGNISGAGRVLEHRLVACEKFGFLLKSSVVRHLNGIKDDNRPENLVVGTTQENTMDHNTARLAAMYWRNQYDLLKSNLKPLEEIAI